MELPFAVEAQNSNLQQGSTLQNSDSSLVTASSQGSFVDSTLLDSPLPPNTPQDVVLPSYQTLPIPPRPPRISGPLSDELEVIDFTYVNISEDDTDGVGVLIEEEDLDLRPETQRGDILTILLSGLQHHGTEGLLVRPCSVHLSRSNCILSPISLTLYLSESNRKRQ